MTIVEVKNQIIAHFIENTTFSLADDIESIEMPDELLPFRAEAIRSAMVDLEKIDMVRRLNTAALECWVLVTSFGSYQQTVQIGPALAVMIAETVNSFREAAELTDDEVDATRVTEGDLFNLVMICRQTLESDSMEDETHE